MTTAAVPWGDLPMLQEVPPLGDIGPDEDKPVPLPVMVRLDREGGLHFTQGSAGILHAGDGCTAVPGRIADFAVNADMVVLLQPDALSAVDHSGRPLWTVPGAFGGVLLGEQLFVPQRDTPVVHQIDLHTGGIVRTMPRRPDAGRLFLANSRLCAVYTEDSGHRGVEITNLDGTRTSSALDHFAWLVHPLGFDRDFSVYAWRDHHVARITLSGELTELGRLPGELPPPQCWQVTPHGRIVVAVPGPDAITVLTAG